jgi:hypothetical protein
LITGLITIYFFEISGNNVLLGGLEKAPVSGERGILSLVSQRPHDRFLLTVTYQVIIPWWLTGG